jgi:hypothetical protein
LDQNSVRFTKYPVDANWAAAICRMTGGKCHILLVEVALANKKSPCAAQTQVAYLATNSGFEGVARGCIPG